MKHKLFRGAATALVTPFNGDRIDYDALAELIERQIDGGISALVIAGTTGEASTMPDQEHIELIEEAVKLASGRVPIIAGTGSNDTAHGVALSKAAEAVGADALLHVTPYYNKTNQEGLVQHFKANAQAVDIPVILYNVPSRTGLNINPETYLKLASIENIVGIKECNIAQMPDTLHLCGDAYSHYSGEDGMVVPLLSLGGDGVISVASNVVPDQMSELTRLWFAGDIAAAAALQVRLMPLINACFSDVNPIPVKAAMELLGYNGCKPRLPLVELAESKREAMASVLADFGLLS